MRRRLLLIAFFALLSFWPAVLRAQQIDSVEVTVSLKEDGSAIITQVWRATVVSGTEWYLPVREDHGIRVSRLLVTEVAPNPDWSADAPAGTPRYISIRYTEEGRTWNTDRSLEEKRYRCGINPTGDGCELCWGQGSLGEHLWVATFKVEGLVQSLQDYDGFNFMFINPELVAPPAKASVTIVNKTGGPEWTEENIRFWGFGYRGSILLEDGKVVARTEFPMETYDSMILMMRLDKGLLTPALSRDIPFEQLEKEAVKGADWDSSGDFWTTLFGLLVLILIFDIFSGFHLLKLLVVLLVALFRLLLHALGFRYEPKIFGTRRVSGYWRDIPLEGNLPQAAYLIEAGRIHPPSRLPARLIGAYFLRWILEGRIRVREGEKGQTELVFPEVLPDGVRPFATPESGSNDVEQQLYQMALSAAGKNRVLEQQEFKKWADREKYKLGSWWKSAQDRGRRGLMDAGLIVSGRAPKAAIPFLTPLPRLYNFLRDFTLSGERSAPEVNLWRDYLVYATLFGIADRVAEQFKKLYPKVFDQISESSHMGAGALMSTVAFSTAISREIRATAPPPPRPVSSSSGGHYGHSYSSSSSGHGGSSSRGGGGGYSGGGRGGGSR